MKIIGIITTTLVVLVLSALWRGYVLSCLWAWFIVPQFGTQQLPVGYAIGLSLLVAFLTHHVTKTDDDEKSWGEKMTSGAAVAITHPALALFVGWIIRSFI